MHGDKRYGSATRDRSGDAGRHDVQPLLQGLHVGRSFGGAGRSRRALDDVSVTVESGECLAVIGGSGSGKTTLVRILLGLQAPDAGTVRYRGEPVAGRRSSGYRLLREESTMVFQDPFASLDPRWDVEHLVEEPLALHRSPVSADRGARRIAVMAALSQAGLDPEEFRHRRPSELSGGQAQRVAIARAIVNHPLLIVADEPMSAIDVSARLQVLDAFSAIRQARPGTAVVIVSHDLGIVQHLADRVLVLHDGVMEEEGPTSQLLEHPRRSYTQELIRAASW